MAGFALLPTLVGNGNKAVVINAGGTAQTVTTGTLALAGNFATAGAFAMTLTATAATSVTLPTTGTLATRDGTETLTNKTISNAGTIFSASSGNALGVSTTANLASFITVGIDSGGTPKAALIGADTTLVFLGSLTNLPVDVRVNNVRVGGFTTTGMNNTPVGATTPAAGAFTTARVNATAALWSGNEVLSVDQSSGNGFVVRSGTSANGAAAFINYATSGDNVLVNFLTDGGSGGPPTQRGSIDYSRVGGLTRYNTTSDDTMKNRFGATDGAKSLSILRDTVIEEWAWKGDALQKRQVGPIAQELYNTFRGAVSVGGEHEDGAYQPWGVDKTAFSFHLVVGWQQHDIQMEALARDNAELRARIEALEKKE